VYDEDPDEDDDVAPSAFAPIRHQWHTDELGSEVHEILTALEVPAVDDG
jgi:hypothetical protein